jgi:hypothetical protein
VPAIASTAQRLWCVCDFPAAEPMHAASLEQVRAWFAEAQEQMAP